MRQKFIDELIEVIAHKKASIETMKEHILNFQKKIKIIEEEIPQHEQLLKELKVGR